jgi:hypothetical protein
MSLKDDLVALENARKNVGGKPCRVAEILADLPPKDAEALRHLLDETKVFGTQIAAALAKHGHGARGAQIQHHRRRVRGGGCTCPPPGATS